MLLAEREYTSAHVKNIRRIFKSNL